MTLGLPLYVHRTETRSDDYINNRDRKRLLRDGYKGGGGMEVKGREKGGGERCMVGLWI